ncbi:MAG: hypothetical protein V4819_01940 [Verrucomicrobiota bacterium]
MCPAESRLRSSAELLFGDRRTDGAPLKSALHQIIRNHTVIPYTSTSTDFWDALKVLDEDPANPASILRVYNGVSWPKSDTARLHFAPTAKRLIYLFQSGGATWLNTQVHEGWASLVEVPEIQRMLIRLAWSEKA